MIKDKISAIINNPKLSIASSKISPDTTKGFFMLIIDNKHVKNMLIPQFLPRILASSIEILSHSFCWKMKNPDSNNKSNKNKAKKRIELKDKIN